MRQTQGASAGPSFLQETGSGVVISVIVKPRSRRDEIEGIGLDGFLKIRVTAAPVKGAANDSLIRLLSKSIGVPKSSMEILSGETSRRKRVLIRDLSAETARRWWRENATRLKTG